MLFKDIAIRSKDDYSLSARLFDCEEPRAVILVMHGMEEHKGRYNEFASFLRDHRYAVLTCDMRGHGNNAPIVSHIADKGGDRLLVQDVLTLTRWLKKKYDGRRMFLFAHSMGVIIAWKVIQTNSKLYDKVVLCGYPMPQKIASAGIVLNSLIASFKGGRKERSDLITNMVTGGFSRAVPEAKTPLDWLSYNEENVKKYKEDPLCGVEFTLGSYDALFRLMRDIGNIGMYKNVSKDLPIYLISGEDDPCTGGEKGRKTSMDLLKKAGFTRIIADTLPHMRHEILQESGKEDVYRRILEFYESETASGR